MAKLVLLGPHLAVLVVFMSVTMAAPADELADVIAQVFPSNDYSSSEDLFVPPDEKQSFDQFDWRLCKILAARDPGNVVISPVSLKLVLAMLYEGAEGQTATELESVLEMPLSRTDSRKRFHKIINSLLTKQPEYVLDIGNRIYVDHNISVKKLFSRILQYFYYSKVEQVDFKKAAQTVKLMNDWVNASTHGRIRSMFEEDAIAPDVLMVLLNTIYFKGIWLYPFNETDTITGDFQATPTRSVKTLFMNMNRNLYYSESVQMDSKILRLPYTGKKYSMFVVLPNKPNGLDHLMKSVNPSVLRNQLFLMEQFIVNVKLPKFSFEYTTELEGVLKELGLNHIFENAELPRIVNDSSNNLAVSRVFQKAGIEVNEKGTTAFAASGLVVVDRMGENEIPFHATHPFMFYIMDETTGTVLFVGKIVNPSKQDVTLRNPTNKHNVEKETSLHSRMGDRNSINTAPIPKPKPKPKPKPTADPNQTGQQILIPANTVISYNDIVQKLSSDNPKLPLKVWYYLMTLSKRS